MLTLTLAKGPPDPFWTAAADSGTATFPCPNKQGPPPYFFFSTFLVPNSSGTATFPCPNKQGPPPYFFISTFLVPNSSGTATF